MMLGKSVIDHGMILEHHVCGDCTEIIGDIVETGATFWQTAQPMNDLVAIEKEYGDRRKQNIQNRVSWISDECTTYSKSLLK